MNKKNLVVFFSISQGEYDLLKEEERSEADEVLSDFEVYANRCIEVLKKNRIEYRYTVSEKIVFERITVNRKKLDLWIGVILYRKDGNYKLIKNVMTDVGLLDEIESYYGVTLIKKGEFNEGNRF